MKIEENSSIDLCFVSIDLICSHFFVDSSPPPSPFLQPIYRDGDCETFGRIRVPESLDRKTSLVLIDKLAEA